jgi:hypothetical protein
LKDYPFTLKVWIPLKTKKDGALPTTSEFSLNNCYNCNRLRFQLKEYELIKRDLNDLKIAERLVYAGIIYLHDNGI